MESQQPSSTSSQASNEEKQNGVADHGNLREYFDLLVDSVVDYAFVILDLELRIRGWNIGARRIFGYSDAEILGRPSAVLFTPEDRETGEPENEGQRALKDGCSLDELWHLRKDGSRFWGSGILTRLRDKDGQPRGFAKVMRDLTERKKAEEALRSSEEKFRLFVENVRDRALFQVDTEGRIMGWNTGAEHLFGYSEDEVVGKPLSLLFTPKDRQDRIPEQDLESSLSKGGAEEERWLVRRDGTQFFASWITHPIRDDQNQLRGFAKVLRDETERIVHEEMRARLELQDRLILERQVESANAEVDRSKEELRALAAGLMNAQEEERRRIARELHDDLSQQLAVLEVELTQLRQRTRETEQTAAELDRSLERVARISAEVRSVSHQLHPAILQDFGLEAALRTLVEEFEQTYGLPLHVSVCNLPQSISLATGTVIYRIAQEALRNIARHAPGAHVIVRVSNVDDELRLSIQDDGPGFDPHERKTGLGLVSMQERAHLMGGTLTVRTKQGSGTEISVTVPLSEQ